MYAQNPSEHGLCELNTKRIFNIKAKLTRANIEIRSLQKGPPHIVFGRLILDRKLRVLTNKTEYSVVDGKNDRVIVCPGFNMSVFITHIKKGAAVLHLPYLKGMCLKLVERHYKSFRLSITILIDPESS